MTSAFDEYLILLKIGPAVMRSVAVLTINLGDDDMNISWCSRLLEQMFGYEQGELAGKSMDVLLKPADVENHHYYFKHYREAPETWTRTMNEGVWVEGRKKDGEPIYVQVSLCVEDVGAERCVIAHVADVSRAYKHVQAARPMEVGH